MSLPVAVYTCMQWHPQAAGEARGYQQSSSSDADCQYNAIIRQIRPGYHGELENCCACSHRRQVYRVVLFCQQ